MHWNCKIRENSIKSWSATTYHLWTTGLFVCLFGGRVRKNPKSYSPQSAFQADLTCRQFPEARQMEMVSVIFQATFIICFSITLWNASKVQYYQGSVLLFFHKNSLLPKEYQAVPIKAIFLQLLCHYSDLLITFSQRFLQSKNITDVYPPIGPPVLPPLPNTMPYFHILRRGQPGKCSPHQRNLFLP